jgi:hypothetical protein
MRRLPSLIALPLAATGLLAVSIALAPAPGASAQVPTPKPVVAPTTAVKPAGAPTTAPRAGGIPLDIAGGMVAGGSAVAGAGFYALRRRKRPA